MNDVKLTTVDCTSRLKCIRCRYLLDDPFQSGCGCRACRRCWTDYLNGNDMKDCPGGTTDCKNQKVSFRNKSLLRPDPAAKRDSGRVKIYCINRKENGGCQHTMLMKELDNHLRSECLYNQVECEKCHEKFWQNDLEKHECDMEFEICLFCNRLYTRRDLREKHNNLKSPECCDRYQGPCPYCDYSCKARSIKQHKETCKSWMHDCDFKEAGCTFRGTKYEVKEHVENGVKGHIMVAGEAVSQNQNIIDQYNGSLKGISLEVDKLKDKMFRSNELAKSSINRTQNFRSDPITPHATNPYIPAVVHNNGLFVWKITDVTNKRSRAMSSSVPHMTSEPFYSSQFGFKICARIYLNGDGQATGNYMSLFIVLMKGEYDDILVWPFTNKVTMSLLDQENRNNDHSHTFRPDPKSECFQQPKSEMNTASGVPSFYSIASLQNSRYLKKDTIYVKIRIHPSNL